MDVVVLDRVFHALASGPRRDILRLTAGAPRSVGEIASEFEMSLAAVSKHVHVLADAGLLRLERKGRSQYCRMEPGALDGARASLDELRAFWSGRLDALEAVLAEEPSGQATRPKRRRGRS